MDYTEEAGLFVIGDLSNSEPELEVNHQKHRISCKHAARLNRESSPPLLLAFSVTSGRTLTPVSSLEDEDSDQSIEEWMILGSEEQLGDSNIQLNLSYWSSSEDDSEVEGQNILDLPLVQLCVAIRSFHNHTTGVKKQKQPFLIYCSEMKGTLSHHSIAPSESNFRDIHLLCSL